jgi:quinol monooxygenase YgiN
MLIVHVHVRVKPEYVEAYRTEAATAAHKATAHYAAWRDAVAPMMAAARTSVKFSNVFPDDQGW